MAVVSLKYTSLSLSLFKFGRLPWDISGVFLSYALQTVRMEQIMPYRRSKWLPVLSCCVFFLWVTPCKIALASPTRVVLRMLWWGGVRASPCVALNKTEGQKRKWKCHVKVFVMQWDHVVRDRGCFWFVLCQSMSLSNTKMAVLGFMPLLDHD